VRDAITGPAPSIWVLDGEKPALEELAALGTAVSDEELETRRAAVTPSDEATIIYTSGTTGEPKGCVLTHGNFMAELEATTGELEELFGAEDAATLLVLPMAHVFARIIQVGAIRTGVRLGHAADVRRLRRDVAEFAPTFLLGVPRVFEKLFTSASQHAVSEGRGKRFDRATDLAIAYSQALEQGRVSPVLRARHTLMERLEYARLRAEISGRCRFMISGGAPLGERLAHYFRGIGIPVLEGYGLTETTGAVTVSTPDVHRIGSVGRPLAGTAVRIADDGELHVRGPQVMRGYWGDEPATRAAFTEDGWLHTGDLAEIDEEGFVRITGRKKEILVTSGGKNVAPNVLEERLRDHPLVGPSVVVGDGRPFVAALVTLDPDAAADWAERHGKRQDLRRLATDPDLVAEVQQAVDRANATVSQAESIRRFEVLPEVWSEETGQLTASLKLRRYVVMRQLRSRIDALYNT
jgi:long-chain acyl-CoA synthetase